jgi:hypothetical protein
MRFVIHFLLFFVFLSSQRQRLYLFFCLFLALSSGGSALSVPFSLFHFPHICHEDQVCLAAWDMNSDVE